MVHGKRLASNGLAPTKAAHARCAEGDHRDVGTSRELEPCPACSSHAPHRRTLSSPTVSSPAFYINSPP